MSLLVTDDGFAADDWTGPVTPLASMTADAGGLAIDVPSDTDPATLAPYLDAALIRVDFPGFADGRGFTIATALRRMGFAGRLRAKGHVIADQYAMVRRCGFDEVEIDDDLARRQTEEQWRARADWQARSYQRRLRG